MTDSFSLERGDSPLLISIPHDGRELAPGMESRMTPEGLALPDTDWHVRRLYEFARLFGATVLAAKFSRYVVDLNRASTDEVLYDGQLSTGLCPAKTFSGSPVYIDAKGCDAAEQQQRTREYWQPYHGAIAAELARIQRQFGYALLWDAHSIRGEVPTLFDGMLPDLNIGTNGGKSCDASLQRAVREIARASSYSDVLNGRFQGGFITRHYGNPDANVHAIQLELAQRCYMNENTGAFDEHAAARLGETLKAMTSAFIAGAQRLSMG